MVFRTDNFTLFRFIAPIPRSMPVQTPLHVSGISSRARLSARAALSPSCAQTITPDCLQALYNIPSTSATAAGNSIAITAYGNEVASVTDLQNFLTSQRPDAKTGASIFSVQSVDNATQVPDVGTGEASLDVQYIVGLATDVPTTLVSVGSTNNGAITIDKFIDSIEFLLQQDTPPLVLSTSYTFNEVSDSDPEFAQYARRLCDMYGQLGARGTSVIFASGDSGVAGSFLGKPANCTNSAFVPAFPATCPYVTSVGGTQGIKPEVAAPFTSGGFSNLFPRPDYQKDAVGGYLKALGDTHSGRFNVSGRAFPDVSAQGVNFLINVTGRNILSSGTSASAPTFASIVALLNDELLNEGKSPLGFLNPLLYAKGAAAFNDITTGSNPGCGTDGFPAQPGWDPVTGLGTPDYDKLLTVVSGHPAPHYDNSASTSVPASVLYLFLAFALWLGV
ncbi:peptidase S8/S53 domain-containing protein [Daedaleopsis nitida]|nr:peptidase S8/S53 domain-containing protein [Daedaleopsis nitida]